MEENKTFAEEFVDAFSFEEHPELHAMLFLFDKSDNQIYLKSSMSPTEFRNVLYSFCSEDEDLKAVVLELAEKIISENRESIDKLLSNSILISPKAEA